MSFQDWFAAVYILLSAAMAIGMGVIVVIDMRQERVERRRYDGMIRALLFRGFCGL